MTRDDALAALDQLKDELQSKGGPGQNDMVWQVSYAARLSSFVADAFGSDSALSSMVARTIDGDLRCWTFPMACQGLLDALRGEIGLVRTSPKRVPQAPSVQRVFIIHGHDRTASRQLQDWLRAQMPRLETVVLMDEPSRGRFIGQKFEEEAAQCDFAIAILSPDDFVQVSDTGETYSQMRPNVLYELGWFHGRIGRERTCVVYRQGTHIPTDLAGIGHCEYRDTVDGVFADIERELKAAYGDDIA